MSTCLHLYQGPGHWSGDTELPQDAGVVLELTLRASSHSLPNLWFAYEQLLRRFEKQTDSLELSR